MLTPEFLEGLNGTVAFLSLIGVVVFARFLYIGLVDHGFCVQRWPRSMRGALGLFLMFTGESVIRGWIWWWRHQMNDGLDVSWMKSYPTIGIGAMLLLSGMAIVVSMFSPEAWKHRFGYIVTGIMLISVFIFFFAFQ
jgi:hypothetical protein